MSGLTLRDIREQLAASLDDRIAGFTVRAYPGDGVNGQCIFIYPGSGNYVDYWESYGASGLSAVHLQLQIRTTAADDASAQMVIDELLSSGAGNGRSLIDALRSNKTLDGTVADVMPGSPQMAQFGPDGPFGAVVPVDVYVNKIGGPA